MKIVLIIVLACSRIAAAQTQPYEAAVEKATAALERGELAQAIKMASSAIAVDSDRYEAYYYAGIAAYKADQIDSAENFWKLAAEHAPAAKAALIQRMLAIVGEKRTFDAQVTNANAAARKRDYRGAASLYLAAWKEFPMRDDVGLSAAAMLRRGGDLAGALGVVRQIARATTNPAVSALCRQIEAEATKRDQAIVDGIASRYDADRAQRDTTWAQERTAAAADVQQERARRAQEREQARQDEARRQAEARDQARAACRDRCNHDRDACQDRASSCPSDCQSRAYDRCLADYSSCIELAKPYAYSGNSYYYTLSQQCQDTFVSCQSQSSQSCDSSCETIGNSYACTRDCDATCQ